MDKTEAAKKGTNSNNALTVHSKEENTRQSVHHGKLSALANDSKPPQKPTISKDAAVRDDRNDRTKIDYGICRQGTTSQPKVKLDTSKPSSPFVQANIRRLPTKGGNMGRAFEVQQFATTQ